MFKLQVTGLLINLTTIGVIGWRLCIGAVAQLTSNKPEGDLIIYSIVYLHNCNACFNVTLFTTGFLLWSFVFYYFVKGLHRVQHRNFVLLFRLFMY